MLEDRPTKVSRCGSLLMSLTLVLYLRERLYITSGYSLIQCLKAMMSYEDKVEIQDNRLLAPANGHFHTGSTGST